MPASVTGALAGPGTLSISSLDDATLPTCIDGAASEYYYLVCKPWPPHSSRRVVLECGIMLKLQASRSHSTRVTGAIIL